MANQNQSNPMNLDSARLKSARSTTPNATPMGPMLVFVGLNSLGTGAVQTGVFFLLDAAYRFGPRDNFVFGLFLYASYIAGALSVGPVMRRRRGTRVPMRRVVALLIAIQTAVFLVPQITAWTLGVRTPPVWTVWLVGVTFGVLTGMMWPITESYLSGGRTGGALSRATGKFNIAWSAAVVAAFWLMAPLLATRPITVITGFAFVQASSLLCLRRFPAEPPQHLEARTEPHPASWSTLLVWFRGLLPVGYVLCGAISPLLPSVIDRLGLPVAWMTPIASAWVTSRVVVFFIFERWGAWHGRFWMPWLAGFCLVGGFAGTVAMPVSAGVWALVAALAVFGVGHALAYIGALYYAMELGDAEVDAGGVHEALIGVGYAAGPIIGLAALAAAGSAAQSDDGGAFDAWMLGLVGLVVGLAVLAGVVRTRRPGKTARE